MSSIYILDRNRRFAARLAHALAARCPEYRFLSAENPEEIRQMQVKMSQSAQAIVYSPEQYPGWTVPNGTPILKLREKPTLAERFGERIHEDAASYTTGNSDSVLPPKANPTDEAANDLHPSVYRLAAITHIAECLKTILSGGTSKADTTHLLTYILYAPAPCPVASRVWERLLAGELNQGRRAIGLPLCQPYLLCGPSLLIAESSADRCDLSSLLMRLEYDEINAGELLPYFLPTRQGCLSIPTAAAADDVNESKTDVLVRLVSLLQKALDEANDRSALFVLASGLSHRLLKAILPLCDTFVTVSNPAAVAADIWTAMLGSLLGNLPAGRRHLEMWEDANSSRNENGV